MLMWSKNLPHIQREQKRKHWERYATTDLAGRILGIVGVGAVGREVARLARAVRMVVIGVDQQFEEVDPASLNVDELHPPSELHPVLKRLEFLILATPHTPETEKMMGAEEFNLLPQGAVFINIGRGPVVDQNALIEALSSGHIGHAFLDVFEEEPLPEESPLWDMPNVLVSPHSVSTSDRENGRIVDLFCENLRRFLAGDEMINRLDTEKLY
jgi:phosphoglycerate dehydrogenase-like enzyme